MALKTFQNLKKERQEEIIMVAFEEFALKGYKSASLSEIIKKLGLAKGSFYRYFSSKKELYAYLVQEASNRRLSNLDKLLANPKTGFFKLIKQNFLDKIQFDKDNPVVGAFLFKIMHERENSEISDIIQNMFALIIEQTKSIIELPKFKKKLASYDATLVAFQIFHTQLWLYDYVAYKYKINFEENIKLGLPILNLPDKELKNIIDNSISILKKGL